MNLRMRNGRLVSKMREKGKNKFSRAGVALPSITQWQAHCMNSNNNLDIRGRLKGMDTRIRKSDIL